MAGNIVSGVGEAATNNPLRSAGSLLLHGPVQGMAQTSELVRMLSRAAYDATRDIDADDATKIEHFRQRFNNDLISQRALSRGNNPGGTLVDMGFKPLPNLVQTGAMFGDPIAWGTGGAGKLLEAPLSAIARGVAEHAPMLLKAAEMAKAVPGKIAQAGVSAAEQAGGAVKNAMTGVGERISEKLPGMSSVAGGVVGEKLAEHIPYAGHIAATMAGLGLAGKTTEEVAGFLRRLGETQGDSIVSRLQQLARNPDSPKWMQVAAGKLDALGVGGLAQYTSDMAHSAAHGAAAGAVMGAVGSENPEEAGEMAGGGAVYGALGRGARKFVGADAAARRVMADLGAKQRLAERLMRPVDQGGSGLAPDDLQQIPDGVATTVGHAADILGDSVQWHVLRPGEAVPGGEPGAVASFQKVGDNGKPTIYFRLGDTTDRHLHELVHAVDNAIGAPGEARVLIDSTFSPQQIEQFRQQYAARLAGSNDPAAVQAKVQQLDTASKGDQWVYNELFAEAGYGQLKGAQDKFGPSFMQSILGVNRNRWAQLGDMARAVVLNTVGDFFNDDGTAKVPRGAIFNDPAVYNNPGLRKLFVEHLSTLRREGAPAQAAKGEPTVMMPQALLGKHPQAPKQMLMENGLTLEDSKGNLRRSPVEEKKRDRVKAQQIGQALANEPTRPKGDTTPDTAPRISASGEKEVTGSKILNLLNRVPGFGPFAREVAQHFEQAMGTGNAIRAGYFAVGTSEGGNWRASVARNSGDMPWQQIDLAPFEFRVDSKNHVLITGMSISSAERKIARWSLEGKLDQFWNGDPEAFRRDLMTYLKNHAEGKPGAEGLGENKKNLLNAFVVGKLNPKELNPLREGIGSVDRGGIIRSLRLDRISSHTDSPHQGWQAEYYKKKFNFSPGTGEESERHNAEQFEFGLPGMERQPVEPKERILKPPRFEAEQFKLPGVDEPVLHSVTSLYGIAPETAAQILKDPQVYEQAVLPISSEAPAVPGRPAQPRQSALARRRERAEALATLEPGALNAALQQNPRLSAIDPKAAPHTIPQYRVNGTIINGSGDFARTLISLRSPYSESLKVAILDDNNKVVHSQTMYAGTLDTTSIDGRDFLRLAALYKDRGKNILMSHNHPSGDPTPSQADLTMTKKLENLAETSGFRIIDHVITNGEKYYSIRASQLLPLEKPNVADWENVPRAKLQPITNYEQFASLVKALRQDNQDLTHIIYLSTRRTVLGIERLSPANLDEIWKAMNEGIGLQGAQAVLIDFGPKVSLGDAGNKIHTLQNALKSGGTQTEILDFASAGTMSGKAEGYMSGLGHLYEKPPEKGMPLFSPDMSRGEKEDLGASIGQRNPTGKTATEDALRDLPVINLEVIKRNPDALRKDAALIRRYYPQALVGKKGLTNEQVLDALTDHVENNLLWLHDKMPPEWRDRAKLWYDGARKLTEGWAKKYDLTRPQIAGVIALLSPQRDWFQNVDLARRLLDITKGPVQRGPMSYDMESQVMAWIFDKSKKAMSAKTKAKLEDSLVKMRGIPFAKLGRFEQAIWARAYSTVNDPSSFPILSPEGNVMQLALNDDGEPTRIGWAPFPAIGKAIEAVRDPAIRKISDLLGQQHKIRSFYNNILLPNEALHAAVTSDTHAVAAGLLKPLGGESNEVLHNFGGAAKGKMSPLSSVVDGISGLYGVHAEAYRRAAAKRGPLLPRQLQSITWEAGRNLFKDVWKTEENQALVNRLWAEYIHGRKSLNETREAIYHAAGGIKQPEWVK